MDILELKAGLRARGIDLHLRPCGTRLAVLKKDTPLLSEELKEGIRRHHPELLMTQLYARAAAAFREHATETLGLDPAGPAYRAAITASVPEDLYERANDAWLSGDLETFKEALENLYSPRYAALYQAVHPGPPEQQSLLEGYNHEHHYTS